MVYFPKAYIEKRRKFLSHFRFAAVQLAFSQFSEAFVGFKGEKLHDTFNSVSEYIYSGNQNKCFCMWFDDNFFHLSGP